MKLSTPIHWYEGLFLQPQLFQQQARYWEESIAYRSRLASPFFWGIHRIDLSITNEAVEVDALEAILPSGGIVQLEHVAGGLSRSIVVPESGAIRLLLAVPRLGRRTVGVAGAPDDGESPRFRSVAGEPAVDETTGRGEVPIQRLAVNARLLTSQEDTAGYEVLSLAELAWRDDVVVVTDYVPPSLLVTKSSRLGQAATQIASLLRDTATGFQGDIHPEAGRDTNFETRFVLGGLSASFLVLEEMVAAEAFRPIDVYLALVRIVGELSPIVGEIPSGAPGYDHGDPGAAFRGVCDRIRSLIAALPREYEELRVYGGDGKFDLSNRGEATGLRKEHLSRPLFLAVKEEPGSEGKVDRWIQTNCVVGRRDQLKSYLASNVKGIGRELQEPPPAGIRLGKGYLVYRIVPSGEAFALLREDPDLCFVRRVKDAGHGEVEAPKTLRFFVGKE